MQFFKQKYPQNVSIATKSILRCCADKKMSVYLGENTQVIDFFKYYLKIWGWKGWYNRNNMGDFIFYQSIKKNKKNYISPYTHFETLFSPFWNSTENELLSQSKLHWIYIFRHLLTQIVSWSLYLIYWGEGWGGNDQTGGLFASFSSGIINHLKMFWLKSFCFCSCVLCAVSGGTAQEQIGSSCFSRPIKLRVNLAPHMMEVRATMEKNFASRELFAEEHGGELLHQADYYFSHQCKNWSQKKSLPRSRKISLRACACRPYPTRCIFSYSD